MKRIVTLLMVLAILIATISGCTSGTTTAITTQSTSIATTTLVTSTNTTSTSQQSTTSVDWPTKPIQIIAGAKPGGDTDFNGRAIAEFLDDVLGQPAIVVNVDGSGGAVATRQVHDSNPDGYTALIGHPAVLIQNASGAIEFGLEEFKLVGIMSSLPGDLIIVNKKIGFNTLQDLVDAAKKEPDKFKMAVDVNSTSMIISSMLQDAAGIKLNVVPGGGASAQAASLLGGQVDVTVLPYGTAKGYIDSGDFVPLAVVNEERNAKFQNIPTAVEQGYDVVFKKYYYLALPKDTPQPIADKFTAAVKKIVTENKEYAAMIDKGYSQDPLWMDPIQAMAEFDRMKEVVKKYAVKAG